MEHLSKRDSLVLMKFIQCRDLWESEFWSSISFNEEVKLPYDKATHGTIDPCWIWGGLIGLDEHPYFTICGRFTREAAKLAYMLDNDTDTYPKYIGHICHNKLCINPTHLIDYKA